MKKEQQQVSLLKLVFTQSWEDPEVDQAALKIKPGDHLVAITSGGCNVLNFLLFEPGLIYSIDINPAQSFMLELKIAAMRALDFDEFVCFSGLKDHKDRVELYVKARPFLGKEAAAFWDERKKMLNTGFLMNGRFERFIRLTGKLVVLLQGRKRVMGLFDDLGREEQQVYFDKVWNTRRLHYLFKLLFNKRMLAKRGLVADYFHFDDGSRSFAESFYNRSRKAFRDNPVKGNYFLCLYLLGKYKNSQEVPAYLRKAEFEKIKPRLSSVKIVTSDAQGWLDSMQKDSIDGFALSNICELMSESETERLFKSVARTAKPGGRIIFRNLMITREVPEQLRAQIVKDEPLSRFLYEHDRSFVYGKVAAYQVNK
jgi:S-adenosylmethionine-diacylglycerol 3-amino-3-carboxypropyl transferase